MPKSTPSKSKYRNVKTLVDGVAFDSKKEARRYEDLKLMLRAGLISDLRLQTRWTLLSGDKPILMRSKRYPNGRQLTYVSDFDYLDLENDGAQIIEDCKGFRTDVYKIKRALMEAQGCTVLET